MGRYDLAVIFSWRPVGSWVLRLAVTAVLVGVGAGVSGLLVSVALHAIEHFAYGYTGGTFLEGTVGSPAWRRVAALSTAGVVGAVGWWALRRWGAQIVSVERSVAGARMPVLATVINAGLQVVIVGLGASIGREAAPRELAALVAGWLTEKAGLTARERRILVACGAGAGLAAVYSVPLGGAAFAVEILLAEVSFATALPALATSAIATVVAWIAVPTTPLYTVPPITVSPSLIVWAILAGPVIGLSGVGFVRVARFAERIRPRNWAILIVMPLIFVAVGLASIPLPSILGNGRSLAQIAFEDAVPIGMMVILMVAKLLATTATVGSGAAGGMLTPSVALGASLGAVLGGLWILVWPGTSIAGFVFVAAAAFLSTSMRAPLTAIILVVEFTHQGLNLLAPTMLAVAGAVTVGYLISRRRLRDIA